MADSFWKDFILIVIAGIVVGYILNVLGMLKHSSPLALSGGAGARARGKGGAGQSQTALGGGRLTVGAQTGWDGLTDGQRAAAQISAPGVVPALKPYTGSTTGRGGGGAGVGSVSLPSGGIGSPGYTRTYTPESMQGSDWGKGTYNFAQKVSGSSQSAVAPANVGATDIRKNTLAQPMWA